MTNSGIWVAWQIQLNDRVKTGCWYPFEWQKHSQANTDVPHYQDLLDFINQASETSCTVQTKKVPQNDQHIRKWQGRAVASLATTSSTTDNNCVVCKTEKHPLYVCAKLKSFPHEEKISVLRSNSVCMNCLGGGHFKQQCKSSHECKSHTILSSTLRRRIVKPLGWMLNKDHNHHSGVVECCNKVAVQYFVW